MSVGRIARMRAHHLCGATFLCVAVALGSGAAQAQQTETVTVTGSRLPSTFQAPTPVTVMDATQIRLSGRVNIEDTLNETPQFRGSQQDGKFNNGQGTGGATLNLRGLGAARNLVLVNGRRFTIQDASQTTDVDTIPTSLIQRTEIVTGGSSAVYGSDAITGVVNFIMRQDFEGVEAQTHVDFDRDSSTPTWSVDLTGGANFAHDKGNIAVTIGYLNRGAISRQDRGGIYIPPYGDGCVTAASASSRKLGVQMTGLSGQACLNAGGKPGLVFAGSGDIPNGRYTPSFLPGGSNAAVNTAYAGAGLSGTGGFGFTFNDQGTVARPAIDPDDRYNLTLPNYLQTPLERWMVNSFVHYDLAPRITAYAEMHFSTNTVVSRLSPSNINATMLFNTNNPYLSSSMQSLLVALDNAEPAVASRSCNGVTSLHSVCTVEGAKAYTTNQGDGIASMNVGRRFTDVGYRISNAQRDAWRFVGGFRGSLPDVRPSFMHDLSYDIYYNYSKTVLTDRENGSVSRSRLQDALLRPTATANPVCDIFGQNITAACVNAISITSTNVTSAQMAGAQASVTGSLFDMPAGPVAFAVGGEWRSTSAQFTPDQFLASGDVAGFNAAQPTRGSESVREFFGETRVPLAKDVPFVQELSINGAFRYSDYNLQGIGAVWTYSGGADWKMNNSISFRGQYQRSIRAPNVGELFGGQTLNFTNFQDPCAIPANSSNATIRSICLAQGVPAGNLFLGTTGTQVQPSPLVGNVSGGNPNLAAEKSETITFGTVITPDFVPGLALSIDWYSIGINGAIAPLGGSLPSASNLCFNVLQDAGSIYCRAFNRDGSGAINAPLYVQINNANTGALKTQGIDIAGQYGFDVDWGLWTDQSSVQVSTNWTWTTEFSLTPVKELTNIKNECVGSFGTTCGSPLPFLKGTTRVTWVDGDLTLSLRHRYQGGVTVDTYTLPLRAVGTVPGLNTLTNPVIPDFNYFDLSMSYNVNDNIRLDGGINNLLNVGPPIVGSSANGNVTFPATYDPNGQTFFFNVTLRTD